VRQDSTCVAFDLMSVNLADLPLLPSLLPALRLLFEKDVEEGDEPAPDGAGLNAARMI
jgi:ribonuclease Z